MVALRVPLVVRRAPIGTQWKAKGVDRAALRDPECCLRFKSALRDIKPPPWDMSVDEHERFASDAVCRAARTAFGPPAKHPLKEHVDDAAWSLICDRRRVKNWCRERRVSAATRGIAPGRTPEPLALYLWATDRCASGALACQAFAALATTVAPLVEHGGACDDM